MEEQHWVRRLLSSVPLLGSAGGVLMLGGLLYKCKATSADTCANNNGSVKTASKTSSEVDAAISAPVQREDIRKGALWMAAAAGLESTVRELLTHGADPDDADGGSRAALAHAAASGHHACVAVLLEEGAEVNRENQWDETALYKAAYGGHEACVALLLAAGANPNRSNINGRTPLMAAAWDGHREMCSQLLNAGADPNIKSQFKKRNSQEGDTAVYWARANGHEECVAVLRAAGAV